MSYCVTYMIHLLLFRQNIHHRCRITSNFREFWLFSCIYL